MSKRGVEIWHNPRCSKSREALVLLQQREVTPAVIDYLKTPPTVDQLQDLVAKLGIAPEQLVRKGESIYKNEYAGRTLTDVQWLQAIAKHPILIERPIVIAGRRAVVGRPPERVLELIQD